jgi:hypothetical protein
MIKRALPCLLALSLGGCDLLFAPLCQNPVDCEAGFGCSERGTCLPLEPGEPAPPVECLEDEYARSAEGIQLLYEFSEGQGLVVHDTSCAGEPTDLELIGDAAWSEESGVLTLRGGRAATRNNNRNPERVRRRIEETLSFTVEAWVRPVVSDLIGPGRIVTWASDSTDENLMLGHGGNNVVGSTFETRGPKSADSPDSNALRAQGGFAVAGELFHLVGTLDRQSERIRLFVDGVLVDEQDTSGRVDTQIDDFAFSLGDLPTGERDWRGDVVLVAVYDRALDSGQIAAHFCAGPTATTPSCDDPPQEAFPGADCVEELFGENFDDPLEDSDLSALPGWGLDDGAVGTIRGDALEVDASNSAVFPAQTFNHAGAGVRYAVTFPDGNSVAEARVVAEDDGQRTEFGVAVEIDRGFATVLADNVGVKTQRIGDRFDLRGETGPVDVEIFRAGQTIAVQLKRGDLSISRSYAGQSEELAGATHRLLLGYFGNPDGRLQRYDNVGVFRCQ